MPLRAATSFAILLFCVGSPFRAVSQPVIHEIHYDPPNPTERVEFIELYNPGANPVALGGWSLTGGVSFEFPSGSSLAAGGYLVVAEDPAALRSRFNVESVGPWTGRLRNENERIELRNTAGDTVDRVEFQLGFPWPTVDTASGYSIELIHPALDNDLGGNWRLSVAGSPGEDPPVVTLVNLESSWRFFRGRSEASAPADAWRALDFDDATWESGLLPIGYDPGIAFGTRLGDMRDNYTSVFLRQEFTVTNVAAITAIGVAAIYDDGFRMWINGVQVLNANLASGELAFDATAGTARESNEYEIFELSAAPGLLREGRNIVAVQAHNSSLTASSDFFFDAIIAGFIGPTGQGPTPGRANIVASNTAPPAIRQVDHTPGEPRTGESVSITAKVTDPQGVTAVELAYQILEPGAYIELTDAAFETQWNIVPMRDDGGPGDAAAGDDVYTVILPPDVQRHRRLVRYRVRATDGAGAAIQVPYPDDPQPNFAYFVYDGVPAWTGAVRPGSTGDLGKAFTVAREEMNRLPVIHLIARRETVEQSTWFSRYGGDGYPWLGTLVVGGKVYDHIRHRARGGVWRYAMTKNMWKFDLNRGHDLVVRDDWGRRLPVAWTKLNLGASIQQGDFNHRGEQGMFESVGFRAFQLAGVPAMHSTFAQFRVIDAAEEAPANDQYEGDFWGVYLMLEQPDGRFLDQHDLPDGNLYKMEGGGGELNNLGPAGPADGSDLNAFLRDYNGATESWWRTNVDIPAYLSYQTVVQAIHHYDICYDKNFFYYRNPLTRQWQVHPWDLDLTWAENMYDAGCGGVDRIKQRLLPSPTRFPAIWRQWQNRIREFRDLFWNQDEAWRLIDEYAGRLRGPATGPTLLDADRAQWDYNPKMTDGRYSTSPSSKAGNGRYYRWSNYPESVASRDFQGGINLMKRYVTFRSSEASANPASLDELADDPGIPARPELRYVGVDGFPVNALRFRASPYSGSASMAAMRWRIGEITRPSSGSWDATEPWKYEIEPVWESGRLTTFQPEIALPPDRLRVGGVYRARVQYEDTQGRTSHWSEPVEFAAGQADTAAALSGSLRLTELMYHAASGSDADFLELHNAGTSALSLAGLAFTEGITYTFPSGATLPPGGYLVVVRADAANNFAAFRTRYGLATTVPIFGPYSGNLSDGGERVVLQSPGGGSVILRVTYSDGRGWPLAADGAGHSLVPTMDFGEESSGALDYAGHWRASTLIGGSPGAADPAPTETVVINEIVAHTDFLSEFDSNDWIEVHQAADVPFVFDADWYLSDDPADLRKWRIPSGTRIGARGFVAFDEVTGFNNPRGTGFSLNKAGEEVFLSHLPAAGRGAVVDAVSFKGQENEIALARLPDGGPYWDQVYPRTRGTANSSTLPRIVISEVMFHEAGVPTNRLAAEYLEYLELHNASGQSMALFNTNAVWRLNGGVDFEFPILILSSDERVVVVSFDPVANPALLAAFRATYGVPGTVRVLGPYTGRLDNDTDRVALERAQAPDQPGELISWVVVDEVLYFDRDPWPAAADGNGISLHRTSAAIPGNNPGGWVAAVPSPGTGGAVSDGDADDDGMPDDWERAHGLDPANAADALADVDADGAVNLAEYQAGTDPRDPSSALRWISASLVSPGVLELTFMAMADRAYVVESSATATGGTWSVVQTIPESATSQTVRVQISVDGTLATAFHRVRLL